MSRDVEINPAGMRWLVSGAGPLADELWRDGQEIAAGAQAGAAKDTGYMASQIVASDGEDAQGYYVDVTTGATRDGQYAYGTRQEFLRPHLVPALERELE